MQTAVENWKQSYQELNHTSVKEETEKAGLPVQSHLIPNLSDSVSCTLITVHVTDMRLALSHCVVPCGTTGGRPTGE